MSQAPRKRESNRPSDSKFKQQNLPAWKPILTPRSVLPTFCALGVIFIVIGIPLLIASNEVKEKSVEYTKCVQTGTPGTGKTCASLLENRASGFTNSSNRCICEIDVDLSGFSGEQVYIYYGLDNYYQNHRRYVKSRSDPQLRSTTAKGSSDCDPLFDEGGKFYAPCGLIANSLFNDTIELAQCSDQACTGQTPLTLSGRGIAWDSDRDTKFQNPSFSGGDPCTAPEFNDAVSLKPPNWPVKACQLGQAQAASPVFNPWAAELGSSGLGYENEDFIVWMRTAALPNFRKLWRKTGDGAVSNGRYRITLGYNYPVTQFDGKKHIIFSTTSWMGGENPFLGVCYIVVGVCCLLVAAFFVFFQRFRGRELGDERFLQWDRD